MARSVSAGNAPLRVRHLLKLGEADRVTEFRPEEFACLPDFLRRKPMRAVTRRVRLDADGVKRRSVLLQRGDQFAVAVAICSPE